MAITKVSESALESNLVKWAKSLGGTALKGATNFDTGYPDRVIYIPGANAYAEIKGTSTRYHLSEKQMLWAGTIIASGASYYIIETREQLERFKQTIGRINIIDGHIVCLNGFDLMLTIDQGNKVYHIGRLQEDGVKIKQILAVPYHPESLINTIYRAFKAISECFPNRNYDSLQ